jgi:UDP-4-amino-4-deoxy-L-arabinose formyltransferase/UDP-glucuronic acid dehydrogenase (UDP-4-keto-hexauronic acid decarboxylating)
VFELTFEENLRIVRRCVKYGTRVVFPSSSEVYGMSSDETFNEDGTPFVLGPVRNQRWIYSCSKQLLDRVIWAYGASGRLRFTLFRPFNWIGPRLDDPRVPKEGSSRVVSQFICDLLAERPIRLVDGGEQRRCFTYIDDGIDCLLSILDNRGGVADGEIFNIGNPANECSMRELARRLSRLFRLHPLRHGRSRPEEPVPVASDRFYGEGYEDIWARKPDIGKARELLGWTPKVGLDEALQRTLDDVLGAPTGHPVALASEAATTTGRTRRG